MSPADPHQQTPVDGAEQARLEAFVQRVLGGEQRAGARLMRMVDDRHPLASTLLRRIHPHTGEAHVIGITGNPGSGKSTLTNQLVRHYRAAEQRVAVVAVDPSSPFTGGAILGDRIRMNDHALDPDVFIRSLATRGHLGGLSRSTGDVVATLDAMGFDVILLETVGVGQDEVEVVKLAHTSVVVLIPGMGDDIQAIKAGLLEIADIFVVNKSDRDGADLIVRDIKVLQSLAGDRVDWQPPIVRTVALTGQGVTELAAAIADHHAYLPTVGVERARRREAHVLESVVVDGLVAAMRRRIEDEGGYERLLDRLVTRETDPWSEAERILKALLDA